MTPNTIMASVHQPKTNAFPLLSIFFVTTRVSPIPADDLQLSDFRFTASFQNAIPYNCVEIHDCSCYAGNE
jgi:hypothetical protein